MRRFLNTTIARLLFAAALLLSLHDSASAEFYSGNDLLALMQSESTLQRGAAMAYVMGVHDATAGEMHCVAGNATGQQLSDMVQHTLQRVPDRRHLSADVIVVASLAVAFPCQQRKAPAGRKTL